MSHPADFEATLEAAIGRAARQLTDEESKAVSDHPGAEELVAYQEGRLEGEALERVRRHLVACADCSRELLELSAFDQDEPSELRPTAAETAADWDEFQQRLAEDKAGGRVLEMPGRPGAASVPAPGAATPARPGAGWQGWLLAASVLLALGGAWLWIDSFSRQAPTPADQLASLRPYDFDLVPDGEALVRDATSAPEIEVPAGMNALLPRLNLGDQTPHDAYRAEILDAVGTAVWRQADLPRQPAGHFTLLVPRAELPAGAYRVSLIGITDGDETALATFSFRLRYAP